LGAKSDFVEWMGRAVEWIVFVDESFAFLRMAMSRCWVPGTQRRACVGLALLAPAVRPRRDVDDRN